MKIEILQLIISNYRYRKSNHIEPRSLEFHIKQVLVCNVLQCQIFFSPINTRNGSPKGSLSVESPNMKVIFGKDNSFTMFLTLLGKKAKI